MRRGTFSRAAFVCGVPSANDEVRARNGLLRLITNNAHRFRSVRMGQTMRACILGLAAALASGNAMAADYLRGTTYEGPPPAAAAYNGYNWGGIYVGGQVGLANTDYDFTQATRGIAAKLLRGTVIENEAHVSDWPALERTDNRGTSYGGFIGYNAQWGEAVLGLEGNYSRMDAPISLSTDSIGRRYTTSDGAIYDVVSESGASAKLLDYGTIRARAGYAMGWIMPYGTIGLAVARADVSHSVSIPMTFQYTNGQIGSQVFTKTESKNGAATFGYAAGFGVDVGLFPGVFLRGEYEFMQLNPVYGIAMRINTVRTALAIKF